MKDSYNREIDYLRISVTDLCDLRCKYCMGVNGVHKLPHNSIMSIERIEEVTKALADLGIRKVRITGGEPLVRKGVIELIKNIKRISGIEEVTLTTNGTRLKDYAKALKENGLDRLNISLDTFRPNKYRELTRNGDLKSVIEGIDEAIKVGFKNIKINVVLLKGFNDDEIDAFFDFANEKKLTIRFIELMPIGESIPMYKTSYISNDVVKNNHRLEFIKNDGVSSLYKIKDGDGYVGIISPLSQKFCSTCNRIRLTADGKIKPCLHSSLEVDINGLSGDELKEKIIQSISLKPKEHHLEEGYSESLRNMSKIGG